MDSKYTKEWLREHAKEFVASEAEANMYLVGKDMDAIMEDGEVLDETVGMGYLADHIATKIPMDEELDDIIFPELVDYYCDQWESMQEAIKEEEEF